MLVSNLIIGGGMAGLLIAHRLKQKNLDFMLIEKNDYLGGRIKAEYFHGRKIPLGAGIMRENDKYGISLCRELDISVTSFETNYIRHPSIEVDQTTIDKLINTIKSTYETVKPQNISFENFIIKYLPDKLALIKKCVTYTDCWDIDIEHLIKFYPLAELFPSKHKACLIDGGWSNVIDHLVKSINNTEKLHTNEEVIYIDSKQKSVRTSTSTYSYDKLFICTDIGLFKKNHVLPESITNHMTSIGSVPYLRFYTYHPFGHNIPHFYYIPGPLNKSIPMGDKILMASYCDNHHANNLRGLIQFSSSSNLKETFNKLLQTAQSGGKYISDYFTDYTYQYWDHGIHYHKHPHQGEHKNFVYADDIYVLGEIVSHYQGWVEGAIHSTADAISHIFDGKN